MTQETWFIDVDMTLPTPASDSLVDALIEATEKLHGTVAVGPGPALGLSLSVEAADAIEAGQIAHSFLTTEIAPLTGKPTLSAFRVLDEATRTAENETPTFPPLVAVLDIAELLGVTRQQAGRLTHKPGFPAPALETRLGALWTRAAVEAWDERIKRAPGRPRYDLTYTDDEGNEYPCTIIDKRPTAGYIFIEYIKDGKKIIENVEENNVFGEDSPAELASNFGTRLQLGAERGGNCTCGAGNIDAEGAQADGPCVCE